MKIFVFCQGAVNTPSGGIKILFELVKVLCDAGYDARIILPPSYDAEHFNPKWFEWDINIERSYNIVTKDDILIIHEEALWAFSALKAKECKHIIFNQGAYWSLVNRLGYNETKHIYQTALGVITNSLNTTELVRKLFGNLKIFTLRLGIDEYFKPGKKLNRICYMPRKNNETAELIAQYTRDKFKDWEVYSIDGLSNKDVANVFSTSKIFFSFGGPEGFGLPPVEAALSGCKVIGYHGDGGREYFKEPIFSSIRYLEIPPFIDKLNHYATILKEIEFNSLPEVIDQIDYLRDFYSKDNFKVDVVAAIKELLN